MPRYWKQHATGGGLAVSLSYCFTTLDYNFGIMPPVEIDQLECSACEEITSCAMDQKETKLSCRGQPLCLQFHGSMLFGSFGQASFQWLCHHSFMAFLRHSKIFEDGLINGSPPMDLLWIPMAHEERSQAEEVASGNCSSMPYNVGTVRTGILRRLEDHLQAVFGADTV